MVVALQPLLASCLTGRPSGARSRPSSRAASQGVDAVTLRLSPSLELTYAAFGGQAGRLDGRPRAMRRLLAPAGGR